MMGEVTGHKGSAVNSSVGLRHWPDDWAVAAIVRFVRRKPLGALGGLIVVVFLAIAIASPWIAPYDPIASSGDSVMEPPSLRHYLGTDERGRDVLSRVLWGARTSLLVAVVAVTAYVIVAISFGVSSGYLGGLWDAFLQRFVDAAMVIPLLLLGVIFVTMVTPSVISVGVVLGFFFGVRDSRVMRATVLSVKHDQFVEAAVAIGCSSFRIVRFHILPNCFGTLVVLVTILWGNAILLEASLGFLGFGVPPPAPSWGRMISHAGRMYFEIAPWMAAFPGLAIALTVFGFNLFGDALRDVLDPRLRGT